MNVYKVEVKEEEAVLPGTVFTRYYYATETFEEAEAKTRDALKKDWPGIKLLITKIEEMFALD